MATLPKKVYQTSILSGATYAGGEWLPWLSATSVDTLNCAQNRNVRFITGQLASTPNEALRLKAGVQSFGYLRDRAAAVELERLLRLDQAAHPRAAQVELGFTWRFKRGTDGPTTRRENISREGGGWIPTNNSLSLLPHLPPRTGERGIGLSL
jgi:hypothetical protein